MAMMNSADLEQHVQDLSFEPPSSCSDHGLEEPWDWLSDDEDSDGETRKFVASFEAQVEDAYRSQEKIQSRVVDMEWCAQHEQKACATQRVQVADQDGCPTQSRRSLYEVGTAASLGQLAGYVPDDSDVADAGPSPVAIAPAAPLRPSPPVAAQEGRRAPRPKKPASSDSAPSAASPVISKQDGEGDTGVQHAPRKAQRQPVRPSGPRRPLSAALSKLRRTVYASGTRAGAPTTAAVENEDEEGQKQQKQQRWAAPWTRSMAGPPAIALRKAS